MLFSNYRDSQSVLFQFTRWTISISTRGHRLHSSILWQLYHHWPPHSNRQWWKRSFLSRRKERFWTCQVGFTMLHRSWFDWGKRFQVPHIYSKQLACLQLFLACKTSSEIWQSISFKVCNLVLQKGPWCYLRKFSIKGIPRWMFGALEECFDGFDDNQPERKTVLARLGSGTLDIWGCTIPRIGATCLVV